MGYCEIVHSDNHSITHITILIAVLKSYSLVSYELRLNCRDLFCVCYWAYPSDVEQGCCEVKRRQVGRKVRSEEDSGRTASTRSTPWVSR